MRKIFIIIGAVLLTAGLSIIGYTLWDFTGANQITQAEQKALSDNLSQKWNSSVVADGSVQDDGIGGEGEPFAKIYVPAWGSDYVKPIVQGTTLRSLDLGVGHYKNTADAGQEGNFAVAAHRTTAGANFENIDKLVKGDNIYVETSTHIYKYEVRNVIIVPPTQVKVIEPVPYGIALEPNDSKAILTMTSCNPKWGDQERIVAFSVLTTTYDKSENQGNLSNIIKP